MLSEKRLQANQRNAQRSTGPRTEEGKKRARGNSWKHGMTGEGVVATQEFSRAVEAERAEFAAQVRPEGARECALVERIALANARMEYCERIELARLAGGQKQAARRFAKRLQMRLRLAIKLFEKDCARGLARLREISIGCRWLAGQWDSLAEILRGGGAWDSLQLEHASRLCGTEPDSPSCNGLLASLIAQHTQVEDKAQASRGDLLNSLEREIAALTERAQALWLEYEEPEREDELARALVDASSAAMRLSRYDLAAEMTFHRSFKALRQGRASRPPAPAAAARPLAQNEPIAEHLTGNREAVCVIVPQWQTARSGPVLTPPRRHFPPSRAPLPHDQPARAASEVAAACLACG